MRSLNKGDDLSVTNPEKRGATGVFHNSQLTFNLSHLQQLSTIHAESAGVVIVSQV